MDTISDLIRKSEQQAKATLTATDARFAALPRPVDPCRKSAGTLMLAMSKDHVSSVDDAARRVADIHQRQTRGMLAASKELEAAEELTSALDTLVDVVEAGHGEIPDHLPGHLRGLATSTLAAIEQGLVTRSSVVSSLRMATGNAFDSVNAGRRKLNEIRSAQRLASKRQASAYYAKCADAAPEGSTLSIRLKARGNALAKRAEQAAANHRRAYGRF